MLDYGLSSQQLAVICALSSGANMTAAAEQAGVHRNTITNWRRNLLPFQHALADAQYDKAMYFREKLEDLVDFAIQSLHEILTDPNAAPSIKLRASLAVLTTATIPPAPKRQIELNIETVRVENTPAPEPQNMYNDAQPVPEPLAQIVHNDAPSAPEPEPQTVHNDAQSVPQMCVNSRSFAANSSARPKVGRNESCPCGSGKKYKRCCLDADQSQLRAIAA